LTSRRAPSPEQPPPPGSAALEALLGHRFADPALLGRALTHSSYSAEHNERLEFLGDGVLGCAIAEELYTRFPGLPEGKLTRLRASLVREEALAEVAERIGLAGHLRLGGAAARPSVLADAVEALFGAVFVDGGYAAARETVLKLFAPLIETLDPGHAAKDPKTELQELLQAAHRRLPEYRVVSVRGAAHSQSFEVECRVADAGLSSTGSGTSRQRAEQQAALGMLEKLGQAQE
jgi:ribonuclease III